ncbi:MAG TPA: hypothetical protein VEJ41_05025 [Candidatus Acidoferrales bacterium]|nr:hypothetical protein [Candidatus Acidoferrales bacterium]
MNDDAQARRRFWRGFCVFSISLAVYLISTGLRNTLYDNHVLLANAFLHGRVWIPSQPPGIDALLYGEHWYIIEGPMPAILLLPFVAIFGLATNQVIIGAVCAAIAVTAADVLFERMGIAEPARTALVIFAGFGTVMWWSTAFGAVWMFAHVVAVMFALLAIAESYGKARPWLVGLLLACAALTRFPMVLAAIPISYWIFARSDHDVRTIRSFLVGFVPLFVLYVLYNEARWGTPNDIGYTVWYHQDQVGEPTGPPFKLEYLPFNLYSFFVMPYQFLTGFPWLKPTSLGVALTFTSPALLLAFGAEARTREALVWWTATIFTLVPSLLYYVNGFEQFGMRHSLDFLPFVLPLVARGMQRFPTVLSYALIALSVASNAYGVWYSWTYHAFAVVPR